MPRFVVDGAPIDFREGDSLAVAMQREGIHPRAGGCLCLAGDCSSCIATVDGVPYVRTCRTRARPGVVVDRQLDHAPCRRRPEPGPFPRLTTGTATSS